MSQPRLVAAISNISMNLSHDGLSAVADKHGIKMDKLEDHELVLFINRARDKLKLLGAKGVVLGYVRTRKGQTLPLGAVQFIPETFSGRGNINIDGAISKYLTQHLAKRNQSALEIVRAMKQ